MKFAFVYPHQAALLDITAKEKALLHENIPLSCFEKVLISENTFIRAELDWMILSDEDEHREPPLYSGVTSLVHTEKIYFLRVICKDDRYYATNLKFEEFDVLFKNNSGLHFSDLFTF